MKINIEDIKDYKTDQPFQEFLENVWKEEINQGAGDETSDNYEEWLTALEVREIMDYADEFSRELIKHIRYEA